MVLSILERKVTEVLTPFVLRLLEELGSGLCEPVGVQRCSQGAGGLLKGAARPRRLLPEGPCRRFQTFFLLSASLPPSFNIVLFFLLAQKRSL